VPATAQETAHHPEGLRQDSAGFVEDEIRRFTEEWRHNQVYAAILQVWSVLLDAQAIARPKRGIWDQAQNTNAVAGVELAPRGSRLGHLGILRPDASCVSV